MKQSIYLFLISATALYAGDEKTHLERFRRKQLASMPYDSARMEPLRQSPPETSLTPNPTSPTSLSSPDSSAHPSPFIDGRPILRAKTPHVLTIETYPSIDPDAEAARIKAKALQENPELFEESESAHTAPPIPTPMPLSPKSPRTPRRTFIINPDSSLLSAPPSPQRIILPHLSPNNAMLIIGIHARKKTKTPPLPLETNSSSIPTGFTTEQQKSPRKIEDSAFSDAITAPPETQKKQLSATSTTKSSESGSTPTKETVTNCFCPCCFCCSWPFKKP